MQGKERKKTRLLTILATANTAALALLKSCSCSTPYLPVSFQVIHSSIKSPFCMSKIQQPLTNPGRKGLCSTMDPAFQ